MIGSSLRGLHRLLLAEKLNRLANGSEDLRVAGAPAKISGKRFVQFLVSGFRISGQKMFGRQDHSRRAETALRAALQAEPALERVKRRAIRHSFNGRDFLVLVRDGEHQAGHLRLAINKDSAGATARIVAAALGARQPEFLTENIQEQPVRFNFRLANLTVNVKPDLFL